MQINGVGSGHNHSMHQVTNCVHDHSVSKKTGGMTAASSGNSAQQSVAGLNQQQEGQFSLVSWLKNMLSDGKSLLNKFWGGSTGAARTAENRGENISLTEESVMAQVGDPAVRQQTMENNPYFSAIADTGREKQSIWEKVKVKFHNIAGQLMGRFSNKNSLQTKQEKPKEDLRKHSRYREDNLEIDCILTDDSYLMDSYDRKGEYSKLSTKK